MQRLPHARGGVSCPASPFQGLSRSSPRTWGCFYDYDCPYGYAGVFPTHVGVFLRRPRPLSGYRSLPHARGGVSSFHSLHFFSGWSSPRTWGCFCGRGRFIIRQTVFPTHVGVFLVEIESEDTPQGLPHARGGVSRGKPEPDPHPASSPRTWGCFSWWRNDTVSAAVFPTHVGVFLS